jgi:hypothetical protein
MSIAKYSAAPPGLSCYAWLFPQGNGVAENCQNHAWFDSCYCLQALASVYALYESGNYLAAANPGLQRWE